MMQEPQEAGVNKRILLVEDDEVHATMISQILLEETPHEVYKTSDAHTAWRFLQSVKPHLLILDYRLPGMSGLDLYDRLHADASLQDLPVLIISAALPENEVQQRGVVYLKKPFEITDFLQRVEELLAS